jgi:hypothetical protein
MRQRSLAFVVNGEKKYQKMTTNAIRMIREHNKRIHIRVFLTEDSPDFENEIKDQAEVVRKTPIDPYHCGNRGFVGECPEPSIISLDSDIFLFGDIEKLFDAYQDYDVVACRNNWVFSHGWEQAFIPELECSLNSGVVIWNNDLAKKWQEKAPIICQELVDREKRKPLCDWLWNGHSKGLLREEVAFSLFVAEEKLKYAYFKDEECRISQFDYDWKEPENSLLFHSFSSHWQKCYNKLTKPRPKVFKFQKSRVDGL